MAKNPTENTSDMDRNTMGKPVNGLKLAVAMVALAMGMACNYGGDHSTPHAPVNPAMGGAPSESDHTSTDVDDQVGGFGTGTDSTGAHDNNVDRSQVKAAPVVADTGKAK